MMFAQRIVIHLWCSNLLERHSCDVLVGYSGYRILGPGKGQSSQQFKPLAHAEAGDLEKSAKCYEEVTLL